MAKRSRRKAKVEPASEPVLAGVARRMAEVIALIRAGQWNAPRSWEIAEDDPPDDDGGLAPSGVRRRPPDKSGSGSVALPEPDD